MDDSDEGWLDVICRGCGCLTGPEEMGTEFYCVHCAPDLIEDDHYGQ